jgi:hypothetical protein
MSKLRAGLIAIGVGWLAAGGPATAGPPGFCAVDEVCLPGGGFAIDRVATEAETGLNADASWNTGVCGEQVAVGFAAGGIITVDNDQAGRCISAWMTLAPATLYYVRAEMEVDPGVTASIDGWAPGVNRLYGGEAQLEHGWEVVGFTVDHRAVATSEPLELRLFGVRAAGAAGAVRLRDVALIELRPDLGVYARLLADPATGATAVTSPYVYHGGLSANLPPQPPEQWIDLSGQFPGPYAVMGAHFVDGAGTWLEDLDARLQIAYAPDPAAVVTDQVLHSESGVFGVARVTSVAGDVDPLRFAERAGAVRDLLARDADAFRARPGFAPVSWPSILGHLTLFGWQADGGAPAHPVWDDWSAAEPVYALMHELGLNGLVEMTLPPAQEAAVLAAGLWKKYEGWNHFGDIIAVPSPYDLDALADRLAAGYGDVEPAITAYAASYRDLTVELLDEAWGMYFTGPELDAAFREYLRVEAIGCPPGGDPAACSPASFGVAAWDELAPLALDNELATQHMSSLVAAARAGGPLAARLFYWQLRFWSHASATAYATATRFLTDRTPGAGEPLIAPNLGTPFGSYMGLRWGTELQTMIEAGALTGFIGEAFFEEELCHAQRISALADWVDGYAGPALDRRAAIIHPNRGSGARKALALAAHGIEDVYEYAYGPAMFGSDGIAGTGPSAWYAFDQIQAASHTLALAEPALAGGTRVTSTVAILASQSGPLWATDGADTPLSIGEAGTHLALTHGHVPVRFVVEGAVDAATLAGTEVLFVHRTQLAAAAFDAIRAWVEVGGHLVVVGNAPTEDEYAQPSGRVDWLGGEPIALSAAPAAARWDVEGDHPLGVAGARAIDVIDPAAVVIAHYDTGEVAAIETTRGLGRITMIGYDLGAEYETDGSECATAALAPTAGAFPTSYDPVIRAVVAGRLPAGTFRPVWVDHPLVEAVRVTKPGGGDAIALINYDAGPLPAITVTVPTLGCTVAWAQVANQGVPLIGGTLAVAIDEVELIELHACPVPAVAPEVEAGGCRIGGGAGSPALVGVVVGLAAALRQRRRRRAGRAARG